MNTVTLLTTQNIKNASERIQKAVGKYLVETPDGDYFIQKDEKSAKELAAILDRHDSELTEFHNKHI